MTADNKQANISNSEGNVDILMTGLLKHNFDKQLKILGVPNKGGEGTITYDIDIQRLLELIQVDGILEDTSGSSALDKKNTLRTILQKAGTCTLVWGAGAKEQTYSGVISKSEVREVAGRIGDTGTIGKTFSVMLQFAVGTFRG